MSDFLDSFVDEASHEEDKRKKKPIVRVDPLLFATDNDPEFTVVVDQLYSAAQVRQFQTFFKNHCDSFQIVSALDHEVSLTSNITRYYRDNGVDMTKYVRPNSKVLCCGRGMYAFTRSSDLDVKSFYDDVFNESWFFAPITGAYVFPVDTIVDWIFNDNFQRWFAKRQIQRLVGFDPADADLDHDEPVLKMVRSPNRFLEKWAGVETDVAWDLETRGLNPWASDGFIICLTLSFDGKTGYYLPFDEIDIPTLTEFFRGKRSIGSNLKFDVKWLVTRGVSRDVLDIWGDTQHLGHLLNEMRSNGLKPLSWLYTTLGGYDEALDTYQEQYKQASDDYSLIPTPILREYATIDPIASYRIHKKMEKQVEWVDEHFPVTDTPWLDYSTWSVGRLYREIIVPAINTFVDIELTGMPIDIEKLRETSKSLDEKLVELRQRVLEALDATEEELNIDSAEQLGRWLQALGWPKIEAAKKGHYKTNDAILNRWATMGYEAAKAILEYREYSTLMKTFVGREDDESGFFKYIQPDGRVHPNFGVAMADSLRSRCSNPNLQNIPKHGDYAQKIRQFFIPPSDEFVIGESDGAGLQLSLEAQLTGDENMIYVFTELGGDMHSMSAQEIYRPDLTLDEFLRLKKEGDPVIKETRFSAKAVNFSLIFGTTSRSFAAQSLQGLWDIDKAREYIEQFGLQDQLRERKARSIKAAKRDTGKHVLSEHEEQQAIEFAHYWACADFIKDKFMETYPGVAEHIERSIEFAEEHGYIRSPYGSIRRVPQLRYAGEDDQYGTLKNLMNICVNSPIQSMEAVRIYYAMNESHRKTRERGLKSHLVGMVHDSIISFKHRDEIMEVSQIEKQAFEEFWPENRGVPLTLEVEIADPKKDQYWGFGEEIDVPKPKVRRVKRNSDCILAS